jgi:hypothetical protein
MSLYRIRLWSALGSIRSENVSTGRYSGRRRTWKQSFRRFETISTVILVMPGCKDSRPKQICEGYIARIHCGIGYDFVDAIVATQINDHHEHKLPDILDRAMRISIRRIITFLLSVRMLN